MDNNIQRRLDAVRCDIPVKKNLPDDNYELAAIGRGEFVVPAELLKAWCNNGINAAAAGVSMRENLINNFENISSDILSGLDDG